ncbi:MAG: hypothetical protein U9N42_01130 [Campylobacterota bacterium]|nr:hypothetical protein [Campylobacterota bacterium]
MNLNLLNVVEYVIYYGQALIVPKMSYKSSTPAVQSPLLISIEIKDLDNPRKEAISI